MRRTGFGKRIARVPMVTTAPEAGTRRWQVETLDRLTSWIVRLQEPACVICGSTYELTNGHIYSRRCYSTRFDISLDGNCHTQCWSCNLRHISNVLPYVEWYIKANSPQALVDLHARWCRVVKFTDDDLNNLIISHRARFNELRAA